MTIEQIKDLIIKKQLELINLFEYCDPFAEGYYNRKSKIKHRLNNLNSQLKNLKSVKEPANKDIESWAKNIYPDYYPNPKNVHEMNVRTKQRNLQSLLIQGAKAALNGEIKKEQ